MKRAIKYFFISLILILCLSCFACTQSGLYGSYEGILPCADCPGLHTIIDLKSDNTFHMEEIYLERSEEPLITEGTWELDGDIITFRADGYSFEYKVISEEEIRWAPDGEEITGTDLNWSLLKNN